MTTSSSTSPFHPIRAVAIDLDGTLLAPDHSISEENRAAIAAMHEAGVEIILASGRHYQSMLPFARSLPEVRYMVSAQGGYASDVDNEQTFFESHMPTADAKAAINFGLENQLAIVAYAATGLYSLTPPSKWLDYYTKLAGITPTPTTSEAILEESIFKIVYFEASERLDEVQKYPYLRDSQLYTVRSMENIFEQADPKTSKASALKPLIAHLGIDASELATFGDGNNDIPMFELSGFSAAMDRAWTGPKEAATLVTPDGPPETSFARAIQAMQRHYQNGS
ncbi:HAD family hydrolase [Pelagicoccus sp. SDUM812002]|uniref:HAD family hydrolase n=1 Tax=Pelagicoccus sp. SDUM812002 TaxID=3041266 RepID=UPI0028102227|nr:HAD family hydrolase [Pelagicoccus sp. SDUM812002]MDQ8186677.1 HAD family hydrolase [Pelagicoccus sp. SDUM812002]